MTFLRLKPRGKLCTRQQDWNTVNNILVCIAVGEKTFSCEQYNAICEMSL